MNASRRFRSVLFAPASQDQVVLKLPRSGPDCIVLDLEDAVPANAKSLARENAAALAPQLRDRHPDMGIYVRVNSPTTEHFIRDLSALTPALSGIMVPKIESAAQRDEVLAALRSAGLNLLLFIGIETVRGVVLAEEIAGSPRVAAVYFGAEDYVADLGGVRTEEGIEVLYARSRVAMAARLARVAAVDQVVPALHDDARFSADATIGRSLGYHGKLCIHPAQVALANAAFTATDVERDRAQRMVDAFELAVQDGRASIDFEGQMVDQPLVLQARSLLADPAPDHLG